MFNGDNERDQDDEEYMEEMQAFYNSEQPIELTPRQLRNFRNRWEKDFNRATRVLWVCQDGECGIRLQHTDSIDFEI